jgi:hypothetical protein
MGKRERKVTERVRVSGRGGLMAYYGLLGFLFHNGTLCMHKILVDIREKVLITYTGPAFFILLYFFFRSNVTLV